MADAITTKNITSVDEVQSVDNTDKVFVNDNGSFKQISVSNLMKQAPSGVTEETDPTVSEWAKQPTKPSYTADEVGALPVDTKIPTKTSDLTNDSGYLTQIPEEYVTETELGQKGYVIEDDIPEKLPSPGTLTFTGAVNDTYDGSVNKTINIPTGGEGGTSDYNDLSNKPQLNGVTLEGNKTLDQVGVLAKNQGSSNSGKYLSVGSDGNVVPADAPSGGTVDPEQIKQAVNGYLEENPVSGMTAEQEQQLNQNTSDVSDLKRALEQKGLPSGGTTGQVLAKKTDSDYDAEWKDVPTGTSDQYFEMVNSGTTTTNGVSLDITDVVNSGVPSYGKWDALYNWYRSSYDKNSETNYAYKNGLGINQIISKPIKGKPYLREFCRVGGQFYTSNNIIFYGCDSDKALEEDGHSCKQCTKNFEFTQIDNLPDGTEGSGVLVLYPNEEYDYYYCIITSDFYNSDSDNARNATWIGAFDSSILDNPLIEISSSTKQHLKMKDEYLDGYYKNMFSYDKFKEIFRTYFAQMSPKVGIPQTYGKAIYIGGDSLHAYAGGDGVSAPGFVTNWNRYLGFSVCKNNGYAGSKWSELTGGGGIKKAKDLISTGTVYDVIILAWGTNDDTGGNGTIDDPASDAEGCTMVAAMKWIITNLRSTFKKTAIGVIIPPPKNTEDGMKEKGDLMIQVCEQLHAPYKDMRNYISISDLGSDAIHLGTGADKYGAAEASFILDICPYGDILYPGTAD